ncbi:MAG: hypothetical protein ABIZ91_19360 [Gemmatimonadaceae bacterium]
MMLMTLSSTFVTLLQAAAGGTVAAAVVERSWLDTLALVTQSIVSVLLTVMVILGVIVLLALKKSIEDLAKLVRNSHEPIREVLKEAREATADLRALTHSLRGPVALAGETLEDLSDGVRDVMERSAERLERLDTMIGIAQDEVEGVVVGAASMLRGVKAGGSSLRRSLGLGGGKRKSMFGRARRKRPSAADRVRAFAERMRDARDNDRPHIRRHVRNS